MMLICRSAFRIVLLCLEDHATARARMGASRAGNGRATGEI
jgi:hypothetical protein